MADRIKCYCCNNFTKQTCSQCENAFYCSKNCQQSDWQKHKTVCMSEKKCVSNTNKIINIIESKVLEKIQLLQKFDEIRVNVNEYTRDFIKPGIHIITISGSNVTGLNVKTTLIYVFKDYLCSKEIIQEQLGPRTELVVSFES